MIQMVYTITFISWVCCRGGSLNLAGKHINIHSSYHVCVCVYIPVLPYLFELSRQDLQVVEGSSHRKHHLSVIAGSHTDVPALWLLPFTH